MSEDALRIANCSGFYGDRFEAAREMLEDGPIDVLTGDYLAELTMLILWRGQQKRPATGYARTFLKQMRQTLDTAVGRGVRIVVNAGGLNPSGLADALRELARELGVDARIAHVEGDDLRPRLDGLLEAGHTLDHLDTGQPLARLPAPALTVNAYLGAWGIVAALEADADVVVTGRVTDASLTVGPAAWHFGWSRDDWDRLAGAVVAGHVIECGAQATGGNYAFFEEVPGLEHVGFPIAELHDDGSGVITKHDGTGGLVDLGTVTAQLLYEIAGPGYLNPDVTARFDTIRLSQQGPDRVAVHGVRGGPPTDRTKIAINTLGGFRNRADFVLTGLDIDRKADLIRRQLARRLDLGALDEVDWRLDRTDVPDAGDNAAATAHLTLTVTHHDAEPIGRRTFASTCVELGLASYPGFTLTAPPAEAEPFGRFWPALLPASEIAEVAVLPDGRRVQILQTGAGHGPPATQTHDLGPSAGRAGAAGETRTRRLPLGVIAGARSGDKGGNANVGVWVRDAGHYPWLEGLLTPAGVRTLLPEAVDLDVEVHPLPNLLAVNVVVVGLLGEGVASSTRPDPQAKGLGEYLRSRLVEVPVSFVDVTGGRPAT